MRNLFFLFLSGLLFMGISSCKDIRGKGAVLSETRTPGDFTMITSEISADVEITQSAAQSVTVEAQENIQKYIQTTVSGGELTLKVKEGIHLAGNTPVKIIITAPSIKGINLAGSGNISSTNEITGNSFKLQLAGSGDVNLAGLSDSTIDVALIGSGNININGGNSSSLALTISGSGNYNSVNMKARNATVTIQGSGDATLSVSNHLNADISGSGSIGYYGNPTVSQTISGSGSVHKKG